MGKKRSNKKPPNFPSGSMPSMTLREESIGKRKTSVNPKSMLKLDHLRNLAVWASGEASIPSLGAFFGHRLAAVRESLGAPPDLSLVTCQRCESILQPGYNCTIRIEKNRAKARRSRHKRPNISTQNNVVYSCHFCSHRNLKRGTPRGHTKEICPPKAKPPMKSKSSHSIVPKSVNSEKSAMSNPEVKRTDEIASPAMTTEDLVTETPATPSVSTCTTLLEAKRRKRNRSASKKAAEPESNSAALDAEKSVGTSNKRKKKPWTSLKEIAEHSERGNNRSLTHLAIPFLI
ncbi:hypothetical protein RHMOL_Rhmol02G0288000 [Rhododendron molle]|uniref:Uncharacterized protein n=1 Tax=Rhododendron molle TaxID=49168 RepID=A0ACC0PY04_RHOML|nr:hypothetical protein RHMOL_Rhmol02G0288000 [Rhododendron molle]